MNWFPVLIFISLYSLCPGSVIVQKRALAGDDVNDQESFYGEFVISQILGSDSVGLDINSYKPSNESKIIEIIAKYIYRIFEKDDKAFMEKCEKLIKSDDIEAKFAVLGEVSKRLEKIVTGSLLEELLLEHPQFLELRAIAIANVGNSGSTMQNNENPCNGPVPDIGKVNGFYGNPSKFSLMEEIDAGRDAIKTNAQVNGIKLALIDYGFGGQIDSESRLGAYSVTRGYKAGSVGSAIHRIIGAMYLFLGTAGEEKIGRIYNDQFVKGLLTQPIESDAIRCLSSVEERYFTNVKNENPQSAGGVLGSIVTPRTRDCLTKLLAGVLCS